MTKEPATPGYRGVRAMLVAGGLILQAGCSQTPAEKEALHLRRGKDWYTKKNYKKAAIEFKVASQNAPRDAEPLYQLGLTYLLGGAPRQAMESFFKASDLDPKHEGARYQAALFRVGSNKPEIVEEARKVLVEYCKAQPDDAEGLGSLALAEAKVGSKTEAVRLAIASSEKDFSTLRAAGNVIALLAARGDVDSAKQLSREISDRLPQAPAAAVLRAQVSLATGDVADADAQISRALAMKRDFRPALELRLRRELGNRDVQGAEETTRQMSQGSDQRMWAAYARILFSENKVAEGIAEFEKVLKEHNDDIQVRDEYSGMLLAAGRSKEAEAVIVATLTKNSKDGAALLQQATLEIDRGNLPAAGKLVRTLQEMKAFSPQLSYQQARLLGAQGEPAREGDVLAETLKRNPRFLSARLELSRVLMETGKAKDAMTILEQASGYEKQTAEYTYYHNMALMASGNWDEARKEVDRALTAVRSAGFLFQDATLRNHSQDLEGARKSLEEALKLAPTDRATLNLMGAVMAQLGQSKEFVATVRETAAKNPGSTSMQLTLGRQLLGTGDNAGARAAFEAARRTGDAADAEVELAAMDMRAGAMPAAKQRLTELVKTRDGVPARMLLAEIQGRAGAHDGAVQQYLKVLQLEPGNAMAMNNMAETLASGLNKLDDAVFWSQKALALAPSNPVVEDTLGWTLYRQGKYDAALPHLQKSLKDLERPVAHYHLAAVLARTGDKARAQKEFEAAVKQAPASTEKAAAELALAGRAAK